jgi:methylphosphotriester-DNA--protein-cysteine methyltransferase
MAKAKELTSQGRAFIKAARELGTDDDPERFNETVRKIAKAPPSKNAPRPRRSAAK